MFNPVRQVHSGKWQAYSNCWPLCFYMGVSATVWHLAIVQQVSWSLLTWVVTNWWGIAPFTMLWLPFDVLQIVWGYKEDGVGMYATVLVTGKIQSNNCSDVLLPINLWLFHSLSCGWQSWWLASSKYTQFVCNCHHDSKTCTLIPCPVDGALL